MHKPHTPRAVRRIEMCSIAVS